MGTLLACGLIFILKNTESETKRVTGEVFEERIQAFHELLENENSREELFQEISKLWAETVSKDKGIADEFKQAILAEALPYDIFELLDFFATYNFVPATELFANTMQSQAHSFMPFPDYEYGAQYVSAIASVADIVATVQPLTNNTDIPPIQDNYSLFGNSLLRLPEVITNSLSDELWRPSATDCAVLANRFYFTDFSGTYQSQYGTQYFDYNEDIRPVISYIYDVCSLISISPPIESFQ